MSDVVDVIVEALEKKGLTAAAASRLAVGNPKLIANMINTRAKKQEPRHSFYQLERLADVLGLELYFGPPRRSAAPSSRPHFDGQAHAAESAVSYDAQLPFGYLPLPWHARASDQGTAPVALDLTWLRDRLATQPDRIAAVEADLPALGPAPAGRALLLLDVEAERAGEAHWAWRHGGDVRAGRLRFETCTRFIVADYDVGRPLRTAGLADVEPLGRIVWVNWPPFRPDTLA